jgi:hypothetical protein
MTKKEFSGLNKKKQLVLLSDFGNFLANRRHESFIISLFSFEEYYVEVWKRIGLDYIQYIEVVNDNSRLDQYLDGFDIKDLDPD